MTAEDERISLYVQAFKAANPDLREPRLVYEGRGWYRFRGMERRYRGKQIDDMRNVLLNRTKESA